MTLPLTTEQIQQLRRRLLDKGAEINAKLSALLANPTVDLSALLVSGVGNPGMTPEDRLRFFMSTIDGRLRALREGRYGLCERCDNSIPFVHLEQMPWLDLCPTCAALNEPPGTLAGQRGAG